MNLPTKLTTLRLVLIPIFMFFYMADFIPGGWGKLVAVLIFAAACYTDHLDGKIARSRNLVTNLGKFLDPIADKCLVMAGLILAVAYPVPANGGAYSSLPIIMPHYIGVIAAVIILARELIISAFRQIAATRNIVLAADMYGKVKAVFQFITLIYYFSYAFVVQGYYYAIDGTINGILNIVGYVLLAITVIITIISGWKYISNNRKVLKEEK